MSDPLLIRRQETSALSADGNSWLRVMVWPPDPASPQRGVVQVVHGMAEHIERYDEFARYLASLGYIVFGHDHVGHGKSVSSVDELGHIPLQGGKDVLVSDIDTARRALFALARGIEDLPQFVFGHSMGSYVTRAYLARGAQGLSGVILCGTGNPARLATRAGNALARLIGALRGGEYRSRLVDGLVQRPFVASVEDARTDFDWLSTDPDVVDAYLADPLAGQLFSVGGYASLTDAVLEATSPEAAARVPKDLPLLFVAGSDDPVGQAGAGVKRAVELYRKAGVEDVELILYPGMRHEILNEPRREDVYADVEAWLTEQVILADLAQDR